MSLPTRLIGAFVVGGMSLLAVNDARGAACGCSHIATMEDRVKRAGTSSEAWKLILEWARGSIHDALAPISNDELNTKWLQLMRTPSSDWNRIILIPIAKIEQIQAVGGLNDRGEPVIDSQFADTNCDAIVEGVLVHEREHKRFYMKPLNLLKAGFSKKTHIKLRAESEALAYDAERAFLGAKLNELRNRCRSTTFKGVTIDCVSLGSGIRIGEHLQGYVCGDPTKELWTIRSTSFVEGQRAQPVPARNNAPFHTNCVAKDSELEKWHEQVFRAAFPGGGGGWLCVYEDGPSPKITIRNFRPPGCYGPVEQVIRVDAEVSDRCEPD